MRCCFRARVACPIRVVWRRAPSTIKLRTGMLHALRHLCSGLARNFLACWQGRQVVLLNGRGCSSRKKCMPANPSQARPMHFRSLFQTQKFEILNAQLGCGELAAIHSRALGRMQTKRRGAAPRFRVLAPNQWPWIQLDDAGSNNKPRQPRRVP